VIANIKKIWYKSLFKPSFLGIFINPSFIIRLGLYKGIVRYSKLLQGDILDVGCGKKPYRHLFINAHEYVGMDFRIDDRTDHNVIADIFYDGKRFPLATESFANVFSSEAFELISNPDEVLAEIYRVLMPEGYLLLTVPFVWEEHWLPFDYCRYSSSGIKILLERNNFEIIEQIKSTTYFATVWQMFIFFIYQNLFPNNKYIKLFLTFLILSTLNIVGLLFDLILPNSKENLFYHNNIVLAKKRCNVHTS